MGQTWAVVAIGLSIGIALLLLFWSRRPAPAKPAQKSGDQKKPGGVKAASGKDAAEKPPKADATGGVKTTEPARAKTVPEPAVHRKGGVVKIHSDEEDDDEITLVTLTPRADLVAAGVQPPDEDDDDAGPPDSNRPAAVPIIYDAEAAEDEPTRAHAVILVAAVGQTDTGQKRKVNEDRYLVLDDHNLYVVADGMGGHAGGEVASQLAVDVITKAFNEQKFEGEPYANVPRRGGELALAIQMANKAIHEQSKQDLKLQGMGTTIVAARFTPGKERVYIGHVGDSRCYRFRAGLLTQVTTDHTMGAIGMTGPFADHLSRAVGIAPAVKVDLVIAKPRHEDVFVLCSDGLSKMVKDETIRDILTAHVDPHEAVDMLVQRANEKGGRDNITVILVVVKDPGGFVRYAQAQQEKKKKAEAEAAAAETSEPTEPPGELDDLDAAATVMDGVPPIMDPPPPTDPTPAPPSDAAADAASPVPAPAAPAGSTGEVPAGEQEAQAQATGEQKTPAGATGEQKTPAGATGEQKVRGTGEQKAQATGEQKAPAGATGEQKVRGTGEQKAQATGEQKAPAGATGEQKVRGTGEQKAQATGEQKTPAGATGEQKVRGTGEQKAQATGEQKVRGTGEQKARGTGEVGRASSPDVKKKG